jgi:hypothetical protein
VFVLEGQVFNTPRADARHAHFTEPPATTASASRRANSSHNATVLCCICSLQELADLRQQAQIWCDSHHSEGDKLKAEVELLNGQLLQRSNELSTTREQLTEARAERDRALQERQQVGEFGGASVARL